MKKLAMVLLLMFFITGCAPGGAISGTPEAPKMDAMRIHFINVGRADSALVSFGDKHYLIDTGTVESFGKLVQALRMNNVETLEGVFISHTHRDHTGGLAGLLEKFDVKAVYASNISVNKKDGTNVVDEIAQKAGREVTRIRAGDEVILDTAHPQVKFRVLGPRSYFKDDNDNSLVLLLEYETHSCLFTGDMQFDQEESLLDVGAISPCTILKVGHHGNPDASSQEFIVAASPEYAVISTDSSVDTDTPADRVLAELGAARAQVYVTQNAGAGVLIKLTPDAVAAEYLQLQSTKAVQGIVVQSLDKESELLVLRNNGTQAVDLGGWWILSERGGEMFFFDDGAVLFPGNTLSIASGKNPPKADIVWVDKNIWSNDKDDAAVIFDSMGNEAARSSN